MIGNVLVGTMILPHLERRQNPFIAVDSIAEIFRPGILNATATVAQTAFVGGSLFFTTDAEPAPSASPANGADAGRMLSKMLVAHRTQRRIAQCHNYDLLNSYVRNLEKLNHKNIII